MAATDKGLEDVAESEHRLLRTVLRETGFRCPHFRPLIIAHATVSLTDIAIAGQIESNYDETTDSFDAMNLKAELLRGT